MPPSADNRQRREVPSRRKVPAIPIHPTLKVNNLIRLRTRLVLDNDDLLTEILLRLPAKSLIRFKSVCKKWLSIISSDDFCHQHTLRRPKLQPSLILEMDFQKFFYFNPMTTNGEKKMIPYSKSELIIPRCQILQACNGLMLLQFGDQYCGTTVYDPTTERFTSYLGGGYCVYNLTTRRSRKIFLTRNDKYPCMSGINLAFDPSKSPYYKIVCIWSAISADSSHKLTHQIEVYDSESHTWKLGLEGFTSPVHFSSKGTYWNNGIYWEAPGRGRGSFCCFDIGKNEMKTLPFPYSHSETLCAPYLQESNGHLYCYVVESETVTVWELREADDDDDDHHHHRPLWLFKHHDFIRKCSAAKIVRLMGRSDGDEACKLLIHAAGKIWTYNFVDGTYKNPLDFKTQPCYQPKDGRFDVSEAILFGETLALV